jgi:hypothetical protein
MPALPRKGNRWDAEKSKHDWSGAAARVAAAPGEWVLVASHVASGTAQNVRTGKVLPLRDLGGSVEATMRHSRLEGKSRYGDLYVRWTPERWIEQANEQREAT